VPFTGRREVTAELRGMMKRGKVLMELTQNAMTVLQKRYLKRDLNGNVAETPEDMFRRVSRNIAQADLLYGPQKDLNQTEEEFFQLMTSLDFMPNSPTLMNAGRELQQNRRIGRREEWR